jgi:large subunit ribosomal protein L24
MKKIRKGDEVIVITGKDKGKRGTILRVQADGHVMVEGVNIAKKHQKPNPGKGIEGGIVEKTMPIDASNVAIFNPTTKKADRVGIKYLEDGKKIRVFKSNGEAVGGEG